MADRDVFISDEELTSSDGAVIDRALDRLFKARLPLRDLASVVLATLDRPTSKSWRAAVYPNAVSYALMLNKD